MIHLLVFMLHFLRYKFRLNFLYLSYLGETWTISAIRLRWFGYIGLVLLWFFIFDGFTWNTYYGVIVWWKCCEFSFLLWRYYLFAITRLRVRVMVRVRVRVRERVSTLDTLYLTKGEHFKISIGQCNIMYFATRYLFLFVVCIGKATGPPSPSTAQPGTVFISSLQVNHLSVGI